MSATIVPFPGGGRAPLPAASPLRAWLGQHAPLIDAALDLGQTDDAEFRRRCTAIADAEGRGVLEQLMPQVDRIGEHLRRLAGTLSLVAMRLRTTLAADSAR